MGIEFNHLRILNNPIAQTQLNRKYAIHFGSENDIDRFQNNYFENFYNENTIKTMIYKNKELMDLLNKNKIPIQLNMRELLELKQGHCQKSAEWCGRIYKVLPPALKKQVNLKNLKDGALLHDFGKVLIPPEILNKKGKLTDEEHKIMNLHAEIGYQLLKNTGLNHKVLELIRHHHNFSEGNNEYIPDINIQILNLADKYAALTEKRVYKEAYTTKQALSLIYKDVQARDIHPILFYSLVQSIKNFENQTKQTHLSK